MDMLSPFPNQGLHRTSAVAGRSCLSKRHDATRPLPGSTLPLCKAPAEFQTLSEEETTSLDRTPRLPVSASHLGSCAKFSCPLAHCFSLCTCRQQSRSAPNDVQKCKFCSPLPVLSAGAVCVGVSGCMREASCPSFPPCEPDLKLTEVRGSLSLFSASRDRHHFKPSPQYLLNTAFHARMLCKAEQKQYAIYKYGEESIMKFFRSFL